jgi:hypothetical protein
MREESREGVIIHGRFDVDCDEEEKGDEQFYF